MKHQWLLLSLESEGVLVNPSIIIASMEVRGYSAKAAWTQELYPVTYPRLNGL